MELEQYNAVILRLQEELSRIRGDIQGSAQEYQRLLNIKVKLDFSGQEHLLQDLNDGEWSLWSLLNHTDT